MGDKYCFLPTEYRRPCNASCVAYVEGTNDGDVPCTLLITANCIGFAFIQGAKQQVEKVVHPKSAPAPEIKR